MSKLGDYLQKHKIDTRRVLAVSRRLEGLQPEDRAVRLARKAAKGGDESAKELAAKSRRTGRPVSRPTLERALSGKAVTRRARARIVRAVNAVRAHKSKSKGEATAADLF
jgi:hypothetical protein